MATSISVRGMSPSSSSSSASRVTPPPPDVKPRSGEEEVQLRQIIAALAKAKSELLDDGIDRLIADLDDEPDRLDGAVGETASTDLSGPIIAGRYRIRRLLGEGGFGRVFLAWDSELTRLVAIKTPQPRRIVDLQSTEMYLAEARVLASLDHPAIIPVFDAGRIDASTSEPIDLEFGTCFIVSKWISGTDLSTRLKKEKFTPTAAIRLITRIGEALDYAHERNVIHRDVKPSNIVLAVDGTPYLTDFGLAIREDSAMIGRRMAGTPAYMSPEQVRGESHRIDRRTDIYSAGIVLYELLTGMRPFRATDHDELFRLIVDADPVPLRQLDPTIPADLERVCLKAISKRASNRHQTAREFVDELNGCVIDRGVPRESAALPSKSNTGDATPSEIVPKGLRSFDAHDASFYLELLPGVRDRFGLPENVRRWKQRIEAKDRDDSFSVGVLYGPSGSGKSSFVRAGLIPRLDKHVTCVYVEATPDDTEQRLQQRLIKEFPALASEADLSSCMMRLRQGNVLPISTKLCLVIDQFEQFLHGKEVAGLSTLVRALRQCDGERVQCLLLVRDDFWLALSRFLSELEVDLLQGRNSGLVDLFDTAHARKVLIEFGRAYGRLPRTDEMTSEQVTFVDQAITGLKDDGRIIPVRLALFTEIVKARPWTPLSLSALGGASGVGTTFLEETFGSRAVDPRFRRHASAARAVLESLLPNPGSPIKGHMRSYPELLDLSGYGMDPRSFKELINILDAETRLLTPSDPVTGDPTSTSREPGGRYYQLTHDYLVPSLREWLSQKQQLTRRGRAQMLLADRASMWATRQERRQLPSFFEWLTIRLFTKSDRWTATERSMMRATRRRQSGMSLAFLTLVILFLFFGTELSGVVHDTLLRIRATTATMWLAVGQGESIWPLLKQSPDPTLRTKLVHNINPLVMPAETLLRNAQTQSDPGIRRAMILAVGEMLTPLPSNKEITSRSVGPSPEFLRELLDAYENDVDAGIHSSAAWVLARLEQRDELRRVRARVDAGNAAGRMWIVGPNRHDFIVLTGPVQYLSGSPDHEFGRNADEYRKNARIVRTFAIADKETTVEQFQKFVVEKGISLPYPISWSADDDFPQTNISWHLAAAYCNWLSEKDAMPTDQWCYIRSSVDDKSLQFHAAPNYRERRGYRLPTEIEWEYAARAGTTTPWFCGLDETLLAKYAVYSSEIANVGTRKPNDFGLFDMLGNAAEWCDDLYVPRTSPSARGAEYDANSSRVVRGGGYHDEATRIRCASRDSWGASQNTRWIGFRVVRSFP